MSESKTAGFHIVRHDDGGWGWILRSKMGSELARSAQSYKRRRSVEEALWSTWKVVLGLGVFSYTDEDGVKQYD